MFYNSYNGFTYQKETKTKISPNIVYSNICHFYTAVI